MAEPKLRQIEQWFWRSIAGAPCEHVFEPELVAAVDPSRKLDAAGRLAVYADAYFSRLRDVLREDFPNVARLLGEQAFEGVSRQYLKAHPSTAPSLRYLGRAMAGFLRGRRDLPAWLADLAALEWARVNAFDAPDDAPVGIADMTKHDPRVWPQLRMTAVRSLEVVTAAWPVHRLWAQEDPNELEPTPTSIRIWRRPDFQVRHAPMDDREAAALSRLLAGSTFAEVCQVFDDLDEQQAARQSGALLLRWLEDGIIARLQQ